MEVVGYYGMGRKGKSNFTGKHHTEATKLKMSLVQKGRIFSDEHKHKLSLANKGKSHPNKGKPMSEEQKHKLSLAHKGKPSGRKGKTCSKEHKLKISLANSGRKLSEEHKKKLFLANKNKPRLSETKLKISKALKGKIVSDKTKLKLSKINSGPNHPNWQGGISTFPYPFDWTDTLKESIRQRDNYICQECGIHQDELNHKLDIHHIDYDKDNLNPSNLISLCRSCHIKTNYYRDKWYEYFQLFFSIKNFM
jgi:hypothetical protein